MCKAVLNQGHQPINVRVERLRRVNFRLGWGWHASGLPTVIHGFAFMVAFVPVKSRADYVDTPLRRTSTACVL